MLLKLGKHECPIDDNIKYPVASGNQLRPHTKSLADLLRQTDGIRFIISLCAVVNIDLHHALHYARNPRFLTNTYHPI